MILTFGRWCQKIPKTVHIQLTVIDGGAIDRWLLSLEYSTLQKFNGKESECEEVVIISDDGAISISGRQCKHWWDRNEHLRRCARELSCQERSRECRGNCWLISWETKTIFTIYFVLTIQTNWDFNCTLRRGEWREKLWDWKKLKRLKSLETGTWHSAAQGLSWKTLHVKNDDNDYHYIIIKWLSPPY